MGIKNVYDVAARAMSAQIVRMNAIASNLANANNVSGVKEDVYKPLRPVFKTIYSDKLKQTGLSTVDAIKVESLDREPIKTYMPSHPAADANGYIYKAPVNVEEEMVDMMDASRQYQNNVEVITTLKALTMKTLNIGR